MESMFKGTGITALDLDQGLQAALKNQKSYARSQGKYDETLTIASISRQIRRKLQARANTAHSPGLNVEPSEDTSIASGLTRDAAEDDNYSLLGRAYLAIDSSGDDIYLLSYDASLTGGNVYPPGDDYIGVSTATGHTITSNIKQAI